MLRTKIAMSNLRTFSVCLLTGFALCLAACGAPPRKSGAAASQPAPQPARTLTINPAMLTLPDPTGWRQFALAPQLAQATVAWRSGDFLLSDDLKVDPRRASIPYSFYWNVEKIAAAKAVRWQIATQPFADTTDQRSQLNPQGLLAQGEGTGAAGSFYGDFKALLGNRRPDSLYVRILPLAKAGTNRLAGSQSNVIRVYYATARPEGPPLVLPAPVTRTTPDLYRVTLLQFTPPSFYDANRWGCITITGYGKGVPVALKQQYRIGSTICPKSYRGREKVDTFGEVIVWAANGITEAFDWVSGAYNGLKSTIINTILDVTHACDIVGMAGNAAASTCRTVVNTAADAGMVALGIPPSLPDFNQLVDKGVNGAVAMAADALYAQTGVPCTSTCRDLLKKGMKEAGETLKSTSFSPGCVGKEEAHNHGKEPLCLPDNIITKPAPGAIDVPPMARIRVVRQRHLADAGQGACQLYGSIEFRNEFQGGVVWGPAGRTTQVRRQPIRGELYAGQGRILPTMGFGESLELQLLFDQAVRHEFSWTRDLWSRSQIPSPDGQYPRGPDWLTLYSGSEAHVDIWSDCSAAPRSGKVYRMPKVT